jgi:hypothetical protein
MRRGDAREAWNGNIMPDDRVIHFWDGEAEVGQWFAKEVDGYQGTAWDAYYLYGPDAAWDDIPSPLIRSGAIIFDEREAIDRHVRSLIK